MKIDIPIFLVLFESILDKDKSLSDKESKSITKFLHQINSNYKYFTLNQWAYILATTFHETAHTFEPVIEAFWLSEGWRAKNLRYYPYHGRGFVQITWKENYQKFSDILGSDLVINPDLALDYSNSFQILIVGCKEGVFTGKSLSNYINTSKTDYKGARRVINGTDKDDLIASYAIDFQEILEKSIRS